jgi:hypothetical protein
MHAEPTTIIIQRYLDALPGDAAAEPVVRELLERAVGRLRLLCARFLYKSYPRLTRPPAAVTAAREPAAHALVVPFTSSGEHRDPVGGKKSRRGVKRMPSWFFHKTISPSS